jgi:hypothetical protein
MATILSHDAAPALLVKASLASDLRRFRLNAEGGAVTLETLMHALVRAFSLDDGANLHVRWLDDDGDWITLSTEEELMEALHVCGCKLRLDAAVSPKTPKIPAPFSPEGMTVQELRAQIQALKQQRKELKSSQKGEKELKWSQKGETETEQQRKKNRGASPPGGVQRKHLARFVAHATLPEGSVVRAGASLVKTWHVRNDTRVPWPPGAVRLLEVSSEQTPPPATAVTTKLAPGQQGAVSVQLTAPRTPGPFSAFYRLQGPAGRKFGQRLACSLVVAGEPQSTDGDHATAAAAATPVPLLTLGHDDAASTLTQPLLSGGAHDSESSEEDNEDDFVEVTPAGEERFASQLAQLRTMGFTNDNLSIKALKKAGGVVEKAHAALAAFSAHKADALTAKAAKQQQRLIKLQTKLQHKLTKVAQLRAVTSPTAPAAAVNVAPAASPLQAHVAAATALIPAPAAEGAAQ